MHREIVRRIYEDNKNAAETARHKEKMKRKERLDRKVNRYLKKIFKQIRKEARNGNCTFDFYTNKLWFKGEFVDYDITIELVKILRAKDYIVKYYYSDYMRAYNIIISW